ncbi:NAD-dependent DNA ligase subunit A [Vibrio phage Gary]|uniref:DNA ligase (NAD(+)) n=1 Tax=Vibrio phage Gary TaxID=2801534 RepID=A0A7U0G8C3_9CAUD|nr:NAD-dependent DNA ligase [Vibrio phage Gary]QQV88164.1 NAD-dependent DNA ligase subunit A [Vibrio phage Gary]
MKQFIAELQRAYYDGEPLISDEEYDALIRRFPDAEVTIGHKGEEAHMFRMWSLEKKYPCRGDELPNLEPYIESPKLDGCAVDCLYINGKLVQCLTRGDGVKGRDITQNLEHLVPANVDYYAPIMQVTGEVVTTKDIENARNYASGAMNLDNGQEFMTRLMEGGLRFIAYNVQTCADGCLGAMYDNDMKELENLGFHTILSDNVKKAVEHGLIMTDGLVYRLKRNRAYFAAGFTSKYPKGAFAVKEDDEGEITTIENVIWGVGASGKVTPVAIVKEVVLEDAKVTRVTLNNVEYMKAMGITHIGQEVRIIRAGGIIPKIVEAF